MARVASAPVRHNLLANLVGSAVTGAVGLVMVPVFFRVLGQEAYGLIGLYFLLQAWMPVIDAGITPTFSRIVAWERGHGADLKHVRYVLGLAEVPLATAALALCMTFWASSDWIARHWLSSTQIAAPVIGDCLVLMAAALAARLLSGFYRAGLMALERQVEANALFTIVTVLRTVGALCYTVAVHGGIVEFFIAQVAVGVFELGLFRWRLLLRVGAERVPLTRAELTGHIRFALGVAGLSLIWVLASQVDKLVLSKFMPLAQYGLYSLGVHLATVIVLANAPIQQAVLPRMTRLVASGNTITLQQLYGLATAVSISISVGLTSGLAYSLASLSSLLRIDQADATAVARIAVWYAAGNLVVGQLGLCYVLQNATGKLRLHALGSLVLVAVQVPVMILIARSGNAELTAAVYTGVNAIFLLAWLPLAHARFLPGGHWRWLREDWAPSMLVGSAVGLISALWLPRPGSLPALLACAALVTLAVAVAAFVAHRPGRDALREKFNALGST
jgi:O-antigen/teichoic acid export membrane protein